MCSFSLLITDVTDVTASVNADTPSVTAHWITDNIGAPTFTNKSAASVAVNVGALMSPVIQCTVTLMLSVCTEPQRR